MSHLAGIDITFRYDAPAINESIAALECAGWYLTKPGQTAPWYMPFDEDGALDMEVVDGASREDLLRLFQEQRASGATFGTPLYWNGNNSILLIFTSPYRTLTCSINNYDRRLLNLESNITDLRWYYEHIVIPLEREVGVLEAVTATDVF